MKSVQKYNSIDTDVLDIDLQRYNPSGLSPRSKGIYKQWQMDKKDELLVDGYFKECNIITQPISKDIVHTITSYYTKSESKGSLKRKILKLQELRIFKSRKRKKNMKTTLFVFLILIVLVPFICGTDISALIILNKYDCDQILNTHNKWLGINDFLLNGSVSHIVVVTLLLVYFAIVIVFKRNESKTRFHYVNTFRHHTCIVYTLMFCIILVSLCFIVLSIIGSILYSETVLYHQCSNVLISWIIFKFIIYIVVVPLVVFSLCHDIFYHESEYCMYVYGACVLVMAVVAVFFSTDIAGLVVMKNNNCDLSIDGGSKWVTFGVDTFLLYGCSIHLGGVILLLCILFGMLACATPNNCFEPNLLCIIMTTICSAVLFILFLISWGVVGCLLYSEMDKSNISNKQCADVTIAWTVFRFVECIFFQPIMLYVWAVVIGISTWDDS